MSSIKAWAPIFIVLVQSVLILPADCRAQNTVSGRDESAVCEQRRAVWNAEFSKIPTSSPSERIRSIETVAARIGEDPEECVAESIREAIQAEKVRFLTININHQTVSAAAVYSCSHLTQDLKCISSVADDTAHLGATQASVSILPPGQEMKLHPSADLGNIPMRVYFAPEASLLDAPKYTRVDLQNRVIFHLPAVSEQIVLIAIIKEPHSNMYDKFVWLVKPKPTPRE